MTTDKMTNTKAQLKQPLPNHVIGLALLVCVSHVCAEPFIDSLTIGAQSPVTINPGDTATYTLTISKHNRGNRAIYFSVSGLPAGLTASFSPSPLLFTGSELTQRPLP
jgi:hypothetical protein